MLAIFVSLNVSTVQSLRRGRETFSLLGIAFGITPRLGWVNGNRMRRRWGRRAVAELFRISSGNLGSRFLELARMQLFISPLATQRRDKNLAF